MKKPRSYSARGRDMNSYADHAVYNSIYIGVRKNSVDIGRLRMSVGTVRRMAARLTEMADWIDAQKVKP